MEFPTNKRPETFGQTIRTARTGLGLSMGTVATEVGISKSRLRFWELDEVENHELGVVLKLAATLELDALALCELAGNSITDALPPIQPYLRNKYPDLPPEAIREIAVVTEKYGIDHKKPGPEPGEDEH